MAYDNEYYSGNHQDRDRPALIYYQRLVKRYLPQGPCLDFGCGTGHLLRRINRDRIANGVETSDWAAQTASKRNSSVKIYQSLKDVPGGKFTSLISIHVIEHIADHDLKDVFAEFRRILPVGGKLLIVTPDAGGWAHRNKGAKWIALSDPTHINLKGWRDWAALFESAGFKVSRIAADGLYDFPYHPRRWALLDVAFRGWPTLIQFVLGRLIMSPGQGESTIFLLER